MRNNRLNTLCAVSIFTISSLALAAHHILSKNSNGHISKETNLLTKKAPNINPKVLRLALTAYHNAKKEGMDKKKLLTVVDYSKPDGDKRLWVFNLNNNRLLFNALVAHGKNSGHDYATSFSNVVGSRKTSLGLYLTGKTYYGGHGYSLRLKGLDKGFNDNAYKRDIVVHGAWYVSNVFATKYHQIGRSWGCLTLTKKKSKPVINTIKNGTLIFAYADNWSWLRHSKFLRA